MALINSYVLATVFIVLAGSIPTKSIECSDENIKQCKSIPGTHGCKLFNDVRQCFEKIDQDCSDDKVSQELTNNLEFVRAEGEVCPGLADGECFHSAWLACQKKLPTMDAQEKVINSEEGRKKHCGEYSRKMQEAETCTKDLKKQCTSPYAVRIMDTLLRLADKMIKHCAKP